jgi:Flp pilus assembly protein CpaB
VQQSLTGKLTSTRGGAIALGIGAAALAGILLVVYLNRYRDSVQGETAPTSVLVAKNLILAGTSGTILADKKLFEATTIPQSEVKLGALADPAYINGRVAAVDIFPGQQLTTTDFSATTTTAVVTKLSGTQRALSIPIDSIHGSLAEVHPGERVDVYVAFTSESGATGGQALVKLFRPNVMVLGIPAATTTGAGQVILRVPSADAADYAFAADNAKFWFALRPQVTAKATKPDTATAGSLLR